MNGNTTSSRFIATDRFDSAYQYLYKGKEFDKSITRRDAREIRQWKTCHIFSPINQPNNHLINIQFIKCHLHIEGRYVISLQLP